MLSRTIARSFVGALSLAALFGTMAVLAGDSAECPDGYNRKDFAATYTSNCPSTMVASAGTLRLTLTNHDSQTAALNNAGIQVKTATTSTKGTDKCDFSTIPLQFGGSESYNEACAITLDQVEQTITCNIPLSMRRDAGATYRDASAPNDAAVRKDASANDAAALDDAAAQDDASVPDDAAVQDVPVVVDTRCTIRFTPIAP